MFGRIDFNRKTKKYFLVDFNATKSELETWLFDDRANNGAIYYRKTVICRLPRRLGKALSAAWVSRHAVTSESIKSVITRALTGKVS